MTSNIYRKIRPRSKRPSTAINFNGFPFGLNSSVQPHQILPQECSELVNFKINRGGQLQTRQGLVSHTTTPVGAIRAHLSANLLGLSRELIVDSNRKLYYNNANVPTQISSRLLASQNVYMFPFKGVALICDGSYLKYCDGIEEDSLKIAYDSGTGVLGFMVSNLLGEDQTTISLGNGSITRVAYKFTSPSWDTGYTIPPIRVEAYLSKQGAPTGDITAGVRIVSSDILIASGVISAAEDVTLTADKYSAVLFNTDEMYPLTEYYITLEYSSGDASNYIKVHCSNV